MDIFNYIKLIAAIGLFALAGFCLHFYLAYEDAKDKITNLTAQIEYDKKQKEKSDLAQAELILKLNKNQEVTMKTITKLVKVPVTVEEKCVSDVLRESLRD